MTTRAPRSPRKNMSRAAFEWRPAHSLLTAHSAKTVKGEDLGYVTGILYLQPHTLASDKTLCPFSTAECRRDCLVTSGMGAMARQQNARTTRTHLFHDDRQAFLSKLALEIIDLQAVAARSGRALAIRLNGTSDILWERETLEDMGGRTLMEIFPTIQFYDYTKIPLERRAAAMPANYHLTYSLADDNWEQAVDYLLAKQSVAAIVLEREKWSHEAWFAMGEIDVTIIDGDQHDLRFLDPPGSLVQIKPKGTMDERNGMVQRQLVQRLMKAAVKRSIAAA